MQVNIQEPIWDGYKVGIAKRLITEDIEMTISYRDKKGNLTFPETYLMEKKKALGYPSRAPIGRIPELKIIPIKDFTIKKQVILSPEEKARQDYLRSQGL